MSESYTRLMARIHEGNALVGVLGLGYVGLPLAQAFVEKGFAVLGFDTDPTKVTRLNGGRSYIGHISDRAIQEMIALGFQATDSFDRLGEADVILICVPTPLTENRDPDLTFVINSSQAIAASLRPGQLVVLQSTTYPGTTRDVVEPILASSGLRSGHDFFVAYSPEREDPGRASRSIASVPKVVGAADSLSLRVTTALYAKIVADVVQVSNAAVAEACKILENTYRAVNIALVNELKVLYDQMGIDIWEVIAAAKTKPFGFQAFYPGPGLGGHCIPIDPFYLSWAARRYGVNTRLIEVAGEINAAMPAFVVGKIIDALNESGKAVRGSSILLLGMAYKKDVDDPRESPGFKLMDLLSRKGAVVRYHDPHIAILPRMRNYPHLRGESEPLSEKLLKTQDCVVIVTDHSCFDWTWIARHAPLLVDTRNATKGTDTLRRIVRA